MLTRTEREKLHMTRHHIPPKFKISENAPKENERIAERMHYACVYPQDTSRTFAWSFWGGKRCAMRRRILTMVR